MLRNEQDLDTNRPVSRMNLQHEGSAACSIETEIFGLADFRKDVPTPIRQRPETDAYEPATEDRQRSEAL